MNTPHVPPTREETPFSWYVSCGMPAYAALAGVRFDRTFYDFEAIVEAYTTGEPLARALFGPDLRYGGPGWSGISYGHVNCLGSRLVFVPGSEVGHTPLYDSLDEGIAALQRPVDWASAGSMPDYLALWDRLKRAFPDRDIPFAGFGVEGPVTTAWELRGHGFFTDLYDDPERCKAFLRWVTASVVDYFGFLRELNGQPAFTESGVGMVDDVSAMLSPRLWPEMVLPFHEQYFSTQTSGRRTAHVEGLLPSHLHHIDALKLDMFDPAVSPKLQPRDLRDNCHTPFWWRLNAMQVRDFSRERVRRFVYEAVADGASGVFCTIGRIMVTQDAADKVRIFIDAAKHVEQLLADGCSRELLRNYV